MILSKVSAWTGSWTNWNSLSSGHTIIPHIPYASSVIVSMVAVRGTLNYLCSCVFKFFVFEDILWEEWPNEFRELFKSNLRRFHLQDTTFVMSAELVGRLNGTWRSHRTKVRPDLYHVVSENIMLNLSFNHPALPFRFVRIMFML